MRAYAKLCPRFWIGDTGREIRALGTEAQVVALYLMSCPSSTMLGVYYLPLPVIAHETGIPLEGASKALQGLASIGFAYYDETTEVVWVPEMAAHQIGDTLAPADKRVKGIERELHAYEKCKFYGDFLRRYRAAFNLTVPPALGEPEAPSMALGSPSDAPAKSHRSQEQEQEQEQEQAKILAPLGPAADASPIADKQHAPKPKRSSRLPPDWSLSPSCLDWTRQQRPEWSVGQIKAVADQFHDYWIAAPGQKGLKADWEATWRTWVRNQKGAPAVPTGLLDRSPSEYLPAGIGRVD